MMPDPPVISPVQAEILAHLKFLKHTPTAGEIADSLGLPLATVDLQLGTLLSKGLITYTTARSSTHVMIEEPDQCPHCRRPRSRDFTGLCADQDLPAFRPKGSPPLTGIELGIVEAIWRSQRRGHLLAPEELARRTSLKEDKLRKILDALHARRIIQIARLEPAPGQGERPLSGEGPSFRLLIAP